MGWRGSIPEIGGSGAISSEFEEDKAMKMLQSQLVTILPPMNQIFERSKVTEYHRWNIPVLQQ